MINPLEMETFVSGYEDAMYQMRLAVQFFEDSEGAPSAWTRPLETNEENNG